MSAEGRNEKMRAKCGWFERGWGEVGQNPVFGEESLDYGAVTQYCRNNQGSRMITVTGQPSASSW